MARLEDLPLPVVLLLLSFAYGDASTYFAATRSKRTRARRGGGGPRDLAAVSATWAAVVRAVEAHVGESMVSFEFKSKAAPNTDSAAEENAGGRRRGECAPATRAAPGRLFQTARGLLSDILCVSRSSTSHTPDTDDTDQQTLFNEQTRSGKDVKEEARVEVNAHVESELERLLTMVTTRSARPLHQLWLSDMGNDTDTFDVDGDYALWVGNRHWDAIFSSCQDLQRLELSAVSLESLHLPAILRAATTHCRDVRELVMPQQDCVVYSRRNLAPVLDSFHAVLTAWGLPSPIGPRGRGNGLKKLVLPKLCPYEYLDATVAVIGRHLPAVESIDGLRLAAFCRARRLTVDEMRESTLQTWRTFCSGCTNLRELNWCGIPCTDEMFAIFASYLQMRLKTLILPGNATLWRRDYVLQERGEPEPFSSSNRFEQILHACPSLAVLEVQLSDQNNSDHSLLLGDDFLLHVVIACPNLERLVLKEASIRHGVGPSNAITDEGVKALAALRRLRVLELSGVDCSAAALLSIVKQCVLPEVEPRRCINVILGGRGIVAVDILSRFHRTLVELVDSLLKIDGTEIPSFCIRLQLDTHNHALPAMWEMRYISEWSRLQRELSQKTGRINISYDLGLAKATIEC